MTIDTKECLQRGAIGAVGAIPGTLAAHPLDLTKIRMQLNATTSFSTAMEQTLYRGGPMAGVVSGVSQKITTRGPMFFASEVCTQACQRYGGIESRDMAVVVGSFASGYCTGFLASPWEWAKVQVGTQEEGVPKKQQQGTTTMSRAAKTKSVAVDMVKSTITSGQAPSLFRRMRGAGLRNGVFDCTFFGSEHYLSSQCHLSHAFSFALAAALAVLVDYPLDVVVKRSMAKSSTKVVPHGPVMATYRLIVQSCGGSLLRLYNGLGCKGMEFGVSYFVTGAVAPWVIFGFAQASMLT